jgi:hypothetical protein
VLWFVNVNPNYGNPNCRRAQPHGVGVDPFPLRGGLDGVAAPAAGQSPGGQPAILSIVVVISGVVAAYLRGTAGSARGSCSGADGVLRQRGAPSPAAAATAGISGSCALLRTPLSGSFLTLTSLPAGPAAV